MKEVASWLHLPPTSNPKTTNLQRRLRRSSGYVCSFLRRASRRAAPAKVPPVALAPLLASVVIRGSYPLRVGPPPQGQAIGYDLDPSVILAVEVFEVEVDQAGVCCYPCPRFPAYAGCCPFHGPPRARKSPDCAQAARWSPRGSRVRRHRQKRADKGSGNRRRRKRSRRKRWLG